jgi:hypothetical protein
MDPAVATPQSEDYRSSSDARRLHLHSSVDDGASAIQSGEHRALVQSSGTSKVAWLDAGADRILDQDLAQSGELMTKRDDFKTVVSDVAMGLVGVIFRKRRPQATAFRVTQCRHLIFIGAEILRPTPRDQRPPAKPLKSLPHSRFFQLCLHP